MCASLCGKQKSKLKYKIMVIIIMVIRRRIQIIIIVVIAYKDCLKSFCGGFLLKKLKITVFKIGIKRSHVLSID
jgi:hypothetical protein